MPYYRKYQLEAIDLTRPQFTHVYGKTTCYGCGAEFEVVHAGLTTEEAARCDQWLNTLEVTLGGGYGMFHDRDGRCDEMECEDEYCGHSSEPENGGTPHVLICKQCALELCKKIPWIGKIFECEVADFAEEGAKKN